MRLLRVAWREAGQPGGARAGIRRIFGIHEDFRRDAVGSTHVETRSEKKPCCTAVADCVAPEELPFEWGVLSEEDEFALDDVPVNLTATGASALNDARGVTDFGDGQNVGTVSVAVSVSSRLAPPAICGRPERLRPRVGD